MATTRNIIRHNLSVPALGLGFFDVVVVWKDYTLFDKRKIKAYYKEQISPIPIPLSHEESCSATMILFHYLGNEEEMRVNNCLFEFRGTFSLSVILI